MPEGTLAKVESIVQSAGRVDLPVITGRIELSDGFVRRFNDEPPIVEISPVFACILCNDTDDLFVELACVAALRGDVDAALAWLGLSREKGYLPSASHIRADRDFDGIRAAPAFVAGWQALFGPDEPWV